MSHLETTRCDLRPRQADMTEGWLDVTSMPPSHVMIVEDDPAISRLLVELVKLEGFQVSAVPCAQAALDALKQHSADILLTDFKLPDRDGLSLLEQVMGDDANIIGIIMTGFGTIDLAVKAMKLGATDILVKPFEPDQVVLLLKRVREIQQLRHENGLLKQAVVRSANVRLQSFQLEEMGSNGNGATSRLPTGVTGASGEAAAYQRGIVEGERRAREQVGPVHERQGALLATAVTEFERARATTIKKAEEDVTDLALAIASKIVRECIDEKRDLVQRQVREAIARVRDSREVLIRVHPDDRASIEGIRETLFSLFEGPVTMKIEGDLGVAKGGCLLETPTRLIDATIDAQLARLGEALKRDL
jgi:flagellar biosynthesis/type III secretory pathway protein FliH/FixJ family two-component response regulator